MRLHCGCVPQVGECVNVVGVVASVPFVILTFSESLRSAWVKLPFMPPRLLSVTDLQHASLSSCRSRSTPTPEPHKTPPTQRRIVL